MDHGVNRGIGGAYPHSAPYPAPPGGNSLLANAQLGELRKRVLAYEPPLCQTHPSHYGDYYGVREPGNARELVRQVRDAILLALGPDMQGGGPILSELGGHASSPYGDGMHHGGYGFDRFGPEASLRTESDRKRIAALIDRAVERLDRRVFAVQVKQRSWPHGSLASTDVRGTDVGAFDDLLADALAETRKARRVGLPLLARAGAGVVLVRLMDLVGISGNFTTERRIDALAGAAGLGAADAQALMRLVVDGSRPVGNHASHDAGFAALELTVRAMVESGRLKARNAA